MFVQPECGSSKKLPAGTQVSYYLTDDSFDKVVAFYKGFAREYTIPGTRKGRQAAQRPRDETGFFIFDGAKDIATSNRWASIQRPYIGSMKMKGMVPEYHDIRDVTAIVVTQKKGGALLSETRARLQAISHVPA